MILKAAFATLIALHGLIHLLGFAKGWGLASLPQLQMSISRTSGLLWFVAAILLSAGAAALYWTPRYWGLILLLGIGASQVLIFRHYQDAKFGTVANLILLLPALVSVLDLRPTSLRSEYLTSVRRVVAPRTPSTDVASSRSAIVAEADLAPLPSPVQSFLRRAGVVGKPRAHNMRARMTIRIRAGMDQPWMDGTLEQYNDFDAGLRFFFLEATRGPIPVDVAHLFDEKGATMRARVLGLFPVMDAKGAELTRSETVTVLNDMCLFAPSSLLSSRLAWKAIDETRADVTFTLAPHQITATLFFDEEGALVNFVSRDRSQSDGKTSTRLPWWTPVSAYATFGGYQLVSAGDAQWEDPRGPWTYAKVQVLDVQYNVNEP